MKKFIRGKEKGEDVIAFPSPSFMFAPDSNPFSPPPPPPPPPPPSLPSPRSRPLSLLFLPSTPLHLPLSVLLFPSLDFLFLIHAPPFPHISLPLPPRPSPSSSVPPPCAPSLTVFPPSLPPFITFTLLSSFFPTPSPSSCRRASKGDAFEGENRVKRCQDKSSLA